ncbi:MAG: TonB-dependent receptor, partial [Candidatus Zixiibacteriota bacterium]
RVFLQYLTDDLGNRELNKYSRNYDFLQFQVAGPDPILKTKILPALGLNFLEDKEFTYFLYAEVDKQDTWLNYERYDSYSTRRSYPSFNLLGIDIPERQYNRYTLQANFRFRPHQNLKFVLSFKKWIRKTTMFGWAYRYSAATAPVQLRDESSISLEVTQNVSKDMNYEAIFSVRDLNVTQKPGDPEHPGRGLDPDDFYLISEIEDYQDFNNNGVYDPPEPIINLFPDTAGYGSGFSGPAYTFGEFDTLYNLQGGSYIIGNYRFNDNGVQDFLEGEPFIDLNGNGVWDQGDYLNDRNGNGRLDYDRRRIIDQRTPEPYIDGDVILGEPFIDVNSNGVYEPGLDVFVIDVDDNINMDKNRNGQYDGPDMSPLNFSKEIAFEDRNGNGVYDMPNQHYDPGEPFTDVNGNGKYDYGGSSTFLDPGQIGTEAEWSRSYVRTYRGEIKLTRQFGRHDLRAGFALTRDDVQLEEIQRPYLPYTGRADSAAYPDRGAFRDFYDYAPLNGTVYARDKLEYGSMIAMLGLRWDFFLQDVNRLEDLLKWDDRGGTILGDRQKLSPRIGFSYPISDKAKVYFNYGHFFQLPAFVRMYARNTSAVNQSDVLGYPNLDYVKTIQYSFGVRYKMSDYYTVDIQGYFKDEFDKIAQQQVREGIANQIRINQYRNADYGRSRGIELTLEKRGGGTVNGQVSYTYAFAYGKASQTNDFFMEDFLLSREPLTEAALDHDIRHSLKAGIQFYLSTTVKPRLFGLPIPNGWSLSIESIIESGAPYTPDKNYPDIDQTGAEDIERNSLRLPSTAVFDFTFRKEFQVVSIDWSFVLWVENLFDARNVTNVYPGTGRADTDQVRNQVVYGGTEFSNSPTRLDYGRQIRLGLEMSL